MLPNFVFLELPRCPSFLILSAMLEGSSVPLLQSPPPPKKKLGGNGIGPSVISQPEQRSLFKIQNMGHLAACLQPYHIQAVLWGSFYPDMGLYFPQACLSGQFRFKSPTPAKSPSFNTLFLSLSRCLISSDLESLFSI